MPKRATLSQGNVLFFAVQTLQYSVDHFGEIFRWEDRIKMYTKEMGCEVMVQI